MFVICKIGILACVCGETILYLTKLTITNKGKNMPKELTKVCGRCGCAKPLSEFYHNSTKGDYHNNICKSCQLKVNRENAFIKRGLRGL